MSKVDFLKNYAKSYAIQIIFLINYGFAVFLLAAFIRMNSIPPNDWSCGQLETCEYWAGLFFFLTWLFIVIFDILSVVIFYKIEKVFRKKFNIVERDEPTKWQCILFIIGALVLAFNILFLPLSIVFGVLSLIFVEIFYPDRFSG